MPSKALLRPPEALNEARHIEGASQAVNGNTVRVESVFARRDRFVDNWDDMDMQRSLEQRGVKVLHGHGELSGEKRVIVRSKAGSEPYGLTARLAVVLSTGSSTAVPEIDGLAESNPWNSRNATGTHKAPETLAILGMGAVACEMATAVSSLGTKEITIIGRDERLLGRNEPFVGERLEQVFLHRGIKVMKNRTVRNVRRTKTSPSYPFEILLDDDTRVMADELLVATGRQPNTTGLGLEIVGLKSGQWLEVDDSCLVKGVRGEWLYAVGDVNRRALLTHAGKYQGRACAAAILARAGKVKPSYSASLLAKSDHDIVPQVIFTDPEVASVGLTESEARKRGLNIRAVDCDMDEIPGAALHTDGYTGHARIIVDEDHKVMVGATFIGPQVGDLLHAATVAIAGKVPMETLRHSIPSFPTVNEVWLELLENYGFSEPDLASTEPIAA
jgi:dihydrolipoamide dehydrogenase